MNATSAESKSDGEAPAASGTGAGPASTRAPAAGS